MSFESNRTDVYRAIPEAIVVKQRRQFPRFPIHYVDSDIDEVCSDNAPRHRRTPDTAFAALPAFRLSPPSVLHNAIWK